MSSPASPSPLVLITGGAGFIGSHTSDALIREGYRVRILDCLDQQIHGTTGKFPAYVNPHVECIRGDVCNPDDVKRALDGVSAVYHFASLTGVGQSMYNIKNYTDINVSGTASLIETIVKNKFPVKKLVLSSSRAVYGEGSHQCPACGVVYPPIRKREDMEQGRFEIFCPNCGKQTNMVPTAEFRPLTPISVYGWTKKAQEDLVEYAAKTFALPTVVLRYFNVYGSRQSLINPYTGIVSIFFSRLMASQPISIYERGIPLRDFVHVSDVVQANVRALKSELPVYSVLNVGAGIQSSILDVARAIALALGREPCFEDRGEFRVGDIHSCIADLSRTRALLGYEPRISLEAGMREFTAWAQGQKSVDLYQKTVEELSSFGLLGRAGPAPQR